MAEVTYSSDILLAIELYDPIAGWQLADVSSGNIQVAEPCEYVRQIPVYEWGLSFDDGGVIVWFGRETGRDKAEPITSAFLASGQLTGRSYGNRLMQLSKELRKTIGPRVVNMLAIYPLEDLRTLNTLADLRGNSAVYAGWLLGQLGELDPLEFLVRKERNGGIWAAVVADVGGTETFRKFQEQLRIIMRTVPPNMRADVRVVVAAYND